MLKTNTVTTVHQRLRDEHGWWRRSRRFRRYVRLEFPDHADDTAVTVLRPTGRRRVGSPDRLRVPRPLGRPGDAAAAAGVGVRDGAGVFAGTCSCGRCCGWTATPGSPAHVAAFEFFGGVPARLVPDNLQTGVDRADLYDPKMNRAYAELAAHYGTLIDPARAPQPKDKPRVERPMPYIRDCFWRGRECDLADADADRRGRVVH